MNSLASRSQVALFVVALFYKLPCLSLTLFWPPKSDPKNAVSSQNFVTFSISKNSMSLNPFGLHRQ